MANNSYKKFAYYYDEVTSSLNYDLWLEFTEGYLKPGDKVLDLACGSGTFATMLKLKGYDAEGLDLSETIIEIANEKRKINRLDIPFYVADMTNFRLDKKYNVITCFFDSVNFLKTKADVDKLFNMAYKHLETGGYFIFDVFSKEMMKEYENNVICEDYTSFMINWVTTKPNPTTLKHVITIKEDDTEFQEIYFEYYHEMKELLNPKFKPIKISGDFNDDLEDTDERILFVLKKI